MDLAFQLFEAALLLTLAPPLLTNFITLPAGFALVSRLLLECILWNNLPLVVTAVSIPPSARPSPSTSTPCALPSSRRGVHARVGSDDMMVDPTIFGGAWCSTVGWAGDLCITYN